MEWLRFFIYFSKKKLCVFLPLYSTHNDVDIFTVFNAHYPATLQRATENNFFNEDGRSDTLEGMCVSIYSLGLMAALQFYFFYFIW